MAKTLGSYKASQNADPNITEFVTEALRSYTDAEKFLGLIIKEGGSQGLVSPEDMAAYGMGGFIKKYQIHLVDLNWNKWISRTNGLNSILSYAKNKTKLAFPDI
jgi:hypothetical protein